MILMEASIHPCLVRYKLITRLETNTHPCFVRYMLMTRVEARLHPRGDSATRCVRRLCPSRNFLMSGQPASFLAMTMRCRVMVGGKPIGVLQVHAHACPRGLVTYLEGLDPQPELLLGSAI